MERKPSSWLLTGIVVIVLAVGIAGIALAQNIETPQPHRTSFNEKIEEELATNLLAGPADFIVRFSSQPDLSPAYQMAWEMRGEYVYNTLSDVAARTQVEAKQLLDSHSLRYQTFIAGNELYVWAGNLDVAQTLAALPEVAAIRLTRTYYIDPVQQDFTISWAGDLLRYNFGPTAEPEAEYDWGILDVHADQFWSTFGFQGEGIVVANIDTGVQWDHPALINQYRCSDNPTDPSCWYDPSDICTGEVCDNVGHGTHTMGTMVADDNPALPYIAGMAPNAEWIACKGCEYNSCSDYALNSCADWILAPGGDPANRPHVVNNSWGGWGGSDWYLDKVNAWRAAGTFPAFSAGNNWYCDSLGSPGDYQESFGSASHRQWDRLISDFSSKGPSYFGDDPYTKPNISAPGENICSTVPGDGWDCYYSGTSMASPHSAGAVALLWSCNAGLVGQIDQTFEILQDNADPPPSGDCGAPGDGEGNYTYGYGYLNVYASGLLWCGETGQLNGHVYDQSMQPIYLAHLYSTPGPYETSTDVDGFYQMTMMVGTYTVTAEAFGYYPSIASVDIITDSLTTQDFILEAAPMATVSGTVTDAATGWPLYASIEIDGYPYGTIWTDPETGIYSVSLPQGSAFEFTVNAWVPGYLGETRWVGPLSGNATENFALYADLDACVAPGYGLSYGEDFEADNGGFTTYEEPGYSNSWEWGAPSPDPYPGPYPGPGEAHSGANVWATNLDGNYYDYEDSYIESPDIDLNALVGQWFDLSWWQWLFTDGNDFVDIQVSSDGGMSWTTVYGPTSGLVDITWSQHIITLDPVFAVGNFRVRFHMLSNEYYTEAGWYVDDLSIGTCQPQEGGLVVGNVYDSNEGNPLTGAEVTNDSGESTLTVYTEDPNLDDSFFVLFSPPGLHDFTASYPGFNVVTEAVDVLSGNTVEHDFYLPAGHLVVDPASLATTLELGVVQTLPMTLTNDGDGSAFFEMREDDRGLIPSHVYATLVPGYQANETQAPSYAGQNLISKEAFEYALPGGVRLMAANARVLIVAAADAYQIQAMLQAYPDFEVVDLYDARDATPTLDELLDYDSVLLISNNYFYNPEAMGDVLADYVDAGGTVVQTVPTFFGYGWALRGRFVAEGYNALNGTGDWWSWAHLGDYDASHPIMKGVTNASDYYRQVMELPEEAEWVADWTDDEFIATKGKVVGLNTALFDGYMWSGDVPLIVHNSIAWSLSGGDVIWLSEEPISGTIAAGTNQLIDITFDTTMLGQPGDYLAGLYVHNDTPYGRLEIPVTMTVNVPESWGLLEGTISSLGYCDDNPATLEEAQVLIESSSGMTWTLMTEESGYYSWWLDSFGSPYTLMASFANHQDGLVTDVWITAGMTTTQNIDLRWMVPCLSADPQSIAVQLDMGASATLPLTLTNTGAGSASWEIAEQDQGYIPYGATADAGLLAESQGQAFIISESKDALPAQELSSQPYAGGGPDPFGYIFRDSNEPDGPDYEWIEIAPPEGGSGTPLYINGVDDGYYWPIDLPWSFNFYGVDHTQLAVATNGTLYFQDAYLGFVNVPIPGDPGDGVYAFIAHWWDDMYIMPGEVYYLIEDDRIILEYYQVSGCCISPNPATWEVILFANGSILMQYQDATTGDFRDYGANASIGIQGDTETGLQYSYHTQALADGLAICFAYPGESSDCTAGDVIWLSESPITGTLPSDGGLQVVDVTFDASAVNQPGDFLATLNVKSDDPVNPRLGVPITMTIQPPENWGKLTGIVASLGYCDLEFELLDEYLVVVDVGGVPLTATLTAEGYAVWLEQGTYTVTASAEEHVTDSEVAVITPGEVTNLDIGLRWIAPCISVAPSSYSVEVPQGYTIGFPVQVVNEGAGDSGFKLHDRTYSYSSERHSTIGSQPHESEGARSDDPQAFPAIATSPIDRLDADVLLIQDWDAWGYPAMTTILNENDIPYDLINSYQIEEWDFSPYKMIIIPSVQGYDYYNYFNNNIAKFEAFIHDGGLMLMSFCTYGETMMIPFGGDNPWNGQDYNYIVESDHPIFEGVGNPYWGSWASHNSFSGLLPDDRVLVTTGSSPGGDPVMIERDHGYGMLVTGGQTFEIAWGVGWEAGIILENMIPWYYFNFNPGGDALWLSEIPQAGIVSADSTYDIELSFTAFPTMTIGSTYTATLIVKSDDLVMDTYQVPVSMTIIAPVIEISLTPAEMTQSGPPGTVVNYLLTIQNTGNVPDTYDLTLEDMDWPALIQGNWPSLDPGEAAQVSIFVFIPPSAQDAEMDVMTVRATSRESTQVSAATELTTVALYQRLPRLMPPEASLIGEIGGMVEYHLTLWNFSSVSDTIDLTVEADWVVDLPFTSYTLGSFEYVEFTVQVYVPVSVSEGEMDEAILTATSESDPNASDSTSLYTYAGMGRTYLPLVEK